MRSRWKWLGAGALLASVAALVLWLQYAPVDPLPEPAPPPPPEAAAPAPTLAPRPRRPSPPAPAPAPPAAPVPPPQEVIQVPPDGPSGLAVFPAPGTKKLKRGIIVPEGFRLPPGYVRHYQSTDDGQRLPAILMFHPDFAPKGPDGQPLPVPPDRIVPPELAPRGMPVQVLTPPDEQRAPD